MKQTASATMIFVFFTTQAILGTQALPIKPVTHSGVIAATRLRGSGAVSGPAAVAPVSPAGASPCEDRGPKGHFYYAKSCSDCVYKAEYCGCQPAMEYLACITKHCKPSNSSSFATTCAKLESQCSNDLQIQCMGPKTFCTSKFNQLPTGGLGLSLDLTDATKDAYCGPFGKCIGTFHMKAKIRPAHNSSIFSPAPAPAPMVAGAAGVKPMLLQCGVAKPSVTVPKFENKSEWTTCEAPVSLDTAACDLPMEEQAVKAEREAYCVLVNATNGHHLTQPAWVKIANVHGKVAAKAEETESNTTETEDSMEKEEEAAEVEAEDSTELEKEHAGQKNHPTTRSPPDEESRDSFGRPPWMENNKDRKPPLAR